MYCVPSMANELGTPVTPELVLNFQSSAPVLASNAQKLRSLVPPRKTRPPPVVRMGPQFMKGNLCVQARCPVVMSQACSSPMWLAPCRQLIVGFGSSTPRDHLPRSEGCGYGCPTIVVQRYSLSGMYRYCVFWL